MSGNAADTCHVIGKRRFCRSRWHLHGIRDSLTDAGLRTALCAIGAAQITVGALGIIDSSRYQQSSAGFATSVGHLQHESAALHAAIGIGLAVAALRKTPIDGLFPTVVVFLLTLALLSVTDIPGLVAQPAGLVPYALMITACLILVALPHVRASAMEQQHPQSDVPHVDATSTDRTAATQSPTCGWWPSRSAHPTPAPSGAAKSTAAPGADSATPGTRHLIGAVITGSSKGRFVSSPCRPIRVG